ncbi:MAG: hypothetical protein IJI22_01550 [Bacilli bacterium]|nr:hypothetical protein [Bacilli bacterium]
MIVGFSGKKISIIEILCIILILLILIVMAISGISSLIGKENINMWSQEEDLLIAEAEEYVMKNYRDDLVIGDSFDIQLSELESKNYLHNKVSDVCIDKSYISVYKDINNEYVYVPFINCLVNNYSDNNLLYPVIDASLDDDNLLISVREINHNQKVFIYSYMVEIYKGDNMLFDIKSNDINSREYIKNIDLSTYRSDNEKLKIIVSAENSIGFYTKTIINS